MKKKILIVSILFLAVCGIGLAQDSSKTVIFKSLDEALKHPEEVIRLDLSNQELNLSNDFLKPFKNLQYLSLKNDHLKQLPSGIFELDKLKVLDLSGNDFSDLPEKFIQLKNLETLYLNNNDLAEIPLVIGQMEWLKLLDVHDNHIPPNYRYKHKLNGNMTIKF